MYKFLAVSDRPEETDKVPSLPAISIIVPLFNQLSLSQAMLESLLATLPAEMPFEVLLVDDGSTDGTREWLGSLKDHRLRPVINERNLGYAASNNRAATLARAPLLALLNNDLVLHPDWLEPLIAALNAPHLNAGIVGNLQERAADASLDHAGIMATRLGKLEHLRELPLPCPEYLPVLAVTGACCLLRRADFLAVKGFDERYVNGCEDVDLCLKLRSRGLASIVATRSRIVHHVSASRGCASERDENNSRLLYTTWHETLAKAVASAWSVPVRPSILPQSPAAPAGRSKTPDATLLRTDDSARTAHGEQAHLLALSALWREEARWRRLLDKAASTTPAVPLSYSGFNYVTVLPHPFISDYAELHLPQGVPGTNLLVRVTLLAGPLARRLPAARIGLRVSINGIQQIEWPDLPPGRHSLAIDAPASLPHLPTRITLKTLVSPAKPGLLASLLRPFQLRRLRIRRLTADDAPLLELDRYHAKTSARASDKF